MTALPEKMADVNRRSETPEAAAPPALDRLLTVIMAAGTGLAIANIYYAQPLLALIGRGFSGGKELVRLVPTATQLGYAAGILLLVPLSDRVDRRRLIVAQCAALVVALISTALAPTLALLLAASVFVGLFATIAQQIVPFAAELSAPERRGRTVGAVMSGLLVGILLARTLSGLVGEWFSWRATFWLGAALAAAMGMLLGWRLPRSRPSTTDPYHRLLGSLGTLFRREPELRRAAFTQGLLFAGFSAFWTVLALLFELPRYRLGSDAAGLFGILGAAGVFITPLAGRRADATGPTRVVQLGVVVVLASFALMAIDASLLTLAVGVVLMDAGVQMAMIGNQATIYALAGEARGRYNTVFIATMFTSGAAGSAAASAAWTHGGWTAVMLLAAGCAAAALLIQFAPRRAPVVQGVPA